MIKISFVVACYNSSKSLSSVVEEIIATVTNLKSYDYEIILVNDFSKDSTLEVIRELCCNNSKIKGISFAKNFGQQPAMLAGFRASSGDYIVYCDDDGQSPVSDLGKLLEQLNAGSDMVWAKYASKNDAFYKGIGSKINEMMVRYLFNKPKDLQFGNFWIARKFVIQEAIKCQNPFPYLGGVFLKTTSNMSNVELTQRKRAHGRSTYSMRKLISIWLNGFTAFSVAPLRAATGAGAICSLLGFMFMIFLLVRKLTTPSMPIGYSSIMSVILFMGGIQMLMLGLLGEYIGRIYININQVPQYVIREEININD